MSERVWHVALLEHDIAITYFASGNTCRVKTLNFGLALECSQLCREICITRETLHVSGMLALKGFGAFLCSMQLSQLSSIFFVFFEIRIEYSIAFLDVCYFFTTDLF